MTKRSKIIFIIIISFLSILSVYMYKTMHTIIVRHITLEFEDLPESFDNIKTALAADIHAGIYISEEHIRKMSDIIMQSKPDTILFLGDYIYSSPHRFKYYNRKNTDKFSKGIEGLEAKYGKYAVLGNHDNWENKKDISNALYSNGFNLMDNNILFITNEIGDYISLGGIGDYLTDDINFDMATCNVKSNDFHILLSHEPNAPLKNCRKNGYDKLIDLFLSGHTHGLQISFIPMYILERLNKNKKYPFQSIYGIMNYGNMKVYITSGIGASLLPFRLFAYPEIVIITLKRKRK